MLEKMVVDHGSPTLARLKLGSLFMAAVNEDFERELAEVNAILKPKGVALTVLCWREGRALLYLYRQDELAHELEDVDVQAFLNHFGYVGTDVQDALGRLQLRLESSQTFPHEIGVFLGYPLTDVIGFIRNGGQNCLCCGCWKVYSNECDALRAFARFRKCKEVYGRLFASGCPLSRLTVCARTAASAQYSTMSF